MSRPRKPFGAQHPGRLPATMMKVLAAEISDPRRLSRGKKYANDGSVLDIIIEPGIVTCEVQGSRSTPYIAIVEVTQGSGMPLRRDITKRCSCPDDNNWDNRACKHVVATMFALSNEFLLEPELLDTWRGYDPDDNGAGNNDDPEIDDEAINDDEDPDGHESARRHLTLVASPSTDTEEDESNRPPRSRGEDPLRDLLRLPTGSHLPEIPRFEAHEPMQPKTRELATILRDALANLRIDWD